MRFVATLLLLLCLPFGAWANRVALVIGNSQYTSVASLDNPQNDSAAVSKALQAQGFEVLRGDNLGRVEMRNTLRKFRAMADRSEIALVYYAGHGIEIGGVNYLVPVDARLEDERDAGLEMVEVDLVLRQISGARTLKMVVLDACRNNPFVVKMQRSGGNRSVNQGLGDIGTTQADTLISYAAAAGEVTPDGLTGQNSPFTAAFLTAISGPPMDVRRMLGQVRDQMRLTVPGAAPFVYSSLGGGEYVINPRSAGSTPKPAPAPAQGTNNPSISLDFVRIDRGGTVADWDAFLIRYEAQSTHPLYAFALEKRAALQALLPAEPEPAPPQSTAATASAPTTSAPAVTPAFLAPPPVAVPAFLAAPQVSAGASRSGDQAVQQTGQQALVAPSVATVVVPTLTTNQAARSLQAALKQQGCYYGALDGALGRNSKKGLSEFSRQAGVPITLPNAPDAVQIRAVVNIVQAFPDARCPRVAAVRPSRPKAKATTAITPRVAPAAPAAPTETKQKKSPQSGFTTRSNTTKLAPVIPSDCLGSRAKFYDCN